MGGMAASSAGSRPERTRPRPASGPMMSPLVREVARRLVLGVAMLVGVSVLIFAGTQLLPGDVAQAVPGAVG